MAEDQGSQRAIRQKVFGEVAIFDAVGANPRLRQYADHRDLVWQETALNRLHKVVRHVEPIVCKPSKSDRTRVFPDIDWIVNQYEAAGFLRPELFCADFVASCGFKFVKTTTTIYKHEYQIGQERYRPQYIYDYQLSISPSRFILKNSNKEYASDKVDHISDQGQRLMH